MSNNELLDKLEEWARASISFSNPGTIQLYELIQVLKLLKTK